MIRLEHICKTYYGKNVQTNVLKDISLPIEEGELVCIYGPSGCGKTTLLNIIGMMDSYTGGRYFLDNRLISKKEEKAFARLRNQNIGYIFQAFHLVDELNVFDNVCIPMGYAGVSAKERKLRAEKLLQEVGMMSHKNHMPGQLSGGEKQRVAIVRALANNPKIILADEPTGSLEQENGLAIMDILKKLNEQGKTILMVTHDKSLSNYASRVIHMLDGKIAD